MTTYLHPGRLTWNLRIHRVEKENHLPNHHFQIPCRSWSVYILFIPQILWNHVNNIWSYWGLWNAYRYVAPKLGAQGLLKSQISPKKTGWGRLSRGKRLLQGVKIDIAIWMFPKIVVPPNHRVFHDKPSILGYPYFWKHPYSNQTTSRGLVFWCGWNQPYHHINHFYMSLLTTFCHHPPTVENPSASLQQKNPMPKSHGCWKKSVGLWGKRTEGKKRQSQSWKTLMGQG